MNRYIQVTVLLMLLFVGYLAYYSFSIHIGQSRFDEIKSKISVGMEREQVLKVANEVGYFTHETMNELQEIDGQKESVKIDVFSYTNFMMPSLYIVRYNSKDKVREINVDQ